jgi:type IV fimbrial biogenesis protein FimT
MITAKGAENREAGLTIIEIIVVIAIIGILSAIAIPGFSAWLPGYRLKAAARDIYSNMQMAKMGAVRTNRTWTVVFSSGTTNYYQVRSDTRVERTVNLADYGSNITFGAGNATDDIPGGGGAPADSITYAADILSFTSRGSASETGYVYIQNGNNDTYGVGTRITGVVILRRWKNGWE